jgi:hypothetical protein
VTVVARQDTPGGAPAPLSQRRNDLSRPVTADAGRRWSHAVALPFGPAPPNQVPSSGVLWPNETNGSGTDRRRIGRIAKKPWISTAPSVSSSTVSSQACATPVTRPAASSRIWISTGALLVALSLHRPATELWQVLPFRRSESPRE